MDEREIAIIQAGLEVFAAEGFERATMDEIAQKAKVAKGTLFYRYKSKEELFISIMCGSFNKFFEAVQEATANLTGAIECIKKSIEIQTELSFQHPEFVKLLLSEVWGRQDRQRVFRSSIRNYLRFLEKNISLGIKNCEIRPIDPSLMATSIFSMTAGASLHLLLDQNITLQETIEQIQEYWLRGIQI